MASSIGFPTGPSAPVSFPIDDLDYLESRSYFDSFHYPFNVAFVPLPEHAIEQPMRPRLLVCHDMDNGYGDDKWIQGGSNPDAYAIWHWSLVDVFVYFSHHTVTLPPPGWTNAAHRNGVKVLGTFILEWDEGKLKADKLLSTQKSTQLYAERLAELAEALHFDGWLLNLEVELNPNQLPALKEFVSNLTQCLHASVPGSLVIWYDSVSSMDGSLRWQNQLNDNNKPFFDRCDGIFINYSWKEEYPRISADVAGHRKFDVYMGIDVFGRNTYGGGQWNTSVAFDVLEKAGVSAALFAPGWVYENKEPPNFETAQNRWWGLVEKSWKVNRPLPKILPFYANFDQGQGYHYSIEGMLVKEKPWNNISCQQIQPLYDGYTGPKGKPMAVFIEQKGSSYSGGGNLTFRGNIAGEAAVFDLRIFSAELTIEAPISISFSVRSEENSSLGLGLLFYGPDGRTSILIAEDETVVTEEKYDKSIIPSRLTSNLGKREWIVYGSDIQKSGCILTEIRAVCYMKRSHKDGQNKGRKLLNDGTTSANLPPFDASLGHIAIRYSNSIPNFPLASSWLTGSQDAKWSGLGKVRTLDLKITWRQKDGPDSPFKSYNIYVQKLPESEILLDGDDQEFIGLATLNIYYVSNLEVSFGTSTLRFIIQACALDGTCQKIEECPMYDFEVVESFEM